MALAAGPAWHLVGVHSDQLGILSDWMIPITYQSFYILYHSYSSNKNVVLGKVKKSSD